MGSIKRTDRIGESTNNAYNGKMIIISYKNAKDITVQFENGYKTKTTYNHFMTGSVKSPYDKSVYNIGYLGEGKYTAKTNGKMTKQYRHWFNMLTRCYDKEKLAQLPTYRGCTVCDKWLNFQVFAEWFDKNYYEVENDQMCLDKDILIKGNKHYSPNTCVFVPNRINVLFTKSDKARGEYPIGVYYRKDCDKFVSQCSVIVGGKKSQKGLGYFKTPEDAYNVYKEFKESYIRQIANEYKDRIPKKLYDALYKYRVEIAD